MNELNFQFFTLLKIIRICMTQKCGNANLNRAIWDHPSPVGGVVAKNSHRSRIEKHAKALGVLTLHAVLRQSQQRYQGLKNWATTGKHTMFGIALKQLRSYVKSLRVLISDNHRGYVI